MEAGGLEETGWERGIFCSCVELWVLAGGRVILLVCRGGALLAAWEKSPHLFCGLAESSVVHIQVGVGFYIWCFVENL